MAQPTIAVDGSIWKLYPTGRVTVYAWTSPEGGYGVR